MADGYVLYFNRIDIKSWAVHGVKGLEVPQVDAEVTHLVLDRRSEISSTNVLSGRVPSV